MQNYLDEILKIIGDESLSDEALKEALLEYHANDIASVLESLEETQRKKIYKVLNDEELSEIFSYLDDPSEFLMELDNEKVADIIEEMDSDDAVDVLEELDEDYREEIIELIEADAKEDIQMIQSYEDDELGSIMTTNFIFVHNDDEVKVSMNEVIRQAADNDNVTIIYVLDDKNKYYGAIDLRDLFIARADTPLEDIIKHNYPKTYAKEKISDVLQELKEYQLDTYPVLNEEDELIGVITSSDLVEVTDDEMSDDYAKLAGLSGEVEAKASIWKNVGKRLPWLVTLLVLGMLISMLISGFEDVVKELPVVVFFQSLVLGMSGNVGTQSLAVTLRRINSDNFKGKELAKVVFKEARIGFVNGLLLSVFAFVVIGAFISITKITIQTGVDFSYQRAFMISAIIGVSLIVAMTLSSLFGSLIPIIFKKMHVDPAVASGPFITTINDVVAVIVYYGLAAILIWMVL